jgi:UDP-N-acetylmuramate dehydrogenase
MQLAATWAARLGPDRWRANQPLASFTTFHVGGAAEFFADIAAIEEIEALVSDAAAADVPLTVIGGGSNVLVADAGIPGIVVRLRLSAISQAEEGVVRAESGVTINGLVRWTIGRGLQGIESWAGTPGSVGGAIHGNAHWNGRNVGDVVRGVRVLDARGGSETVPAPAMGFAYDSSRLQRTGEIVIWAEFRVERGDPAALRERARASLHYRKATQPLAMPSAGCIFQNPDARDAVPAGIPASAGALVDRAGLKGHRIGGARISERHANFIVNEGRATAADIRQLIETARATVADRFGVRLRDEIVYLGTF